MENLIIFLAKISAFMILLTIIVFFSVILYEIIKTFVVRQKLQKFNKELEKILKEELKEKK